MRYVAALLLKLVMIWKVLPSLLPHVSRGIITCNSKSFIPVSGSSSSVKLVEQDPHKGGSWSPCKTCCNPPVRQAVRLMRYVTAVLLKLVVMVSVPPPLTPCQSGHRERSGSVEECLTRDQGAAGLSLTELWSLSKTHLS